VSEEDKGAEQSQTEVREHLANERTLLSWVRTGVSLISLGLVVERAGALAKAANLQVGSTSGSDFFGLGLAMLGALTLVLGTGQFLRNRRSIETGNFESSVTGYLIIVAGSLAFAGAFAIYVLFTEVGAGLKPAPTWFRPGSPPTRSRRTRPRASRWVQPL
jgi:putative membrane protein